MSARKSGGPDISPRVAAAPGRGWIKQAIPVSSSRTLPARIYGRRVPGRPTKLVLHFHGGAFVSGSGESGATVAGLLAGAGGIVVSLEYPLAPAHPFPQAAEDGHAALSWIHRHRRRLGGEGAVILVAGEEAGGNLAAAVALMARDRQHPPLAGQILLSPMLDPCLGTASLRRADLDVRECPYGLGWGSYLSRAADVGHPYAVPGICLRLGQLPPTLLITAQDDPLRDESLAYAGKLRDAGVDVLQVVVEPVTGWPQSLMTSGDANSDEADSGNARDAERAAWRGTVQEHLRRFITARQEAARSQRGTRH